MTNHPLASDLLNSWLRDPRWDGVERPYTAETVIRLRGSVQIEHTLARMGAVRLWRLLHQEGHTKALGACTGNQAVEQVRAGLDAIYVSGWQVAADANDAGQTYPDLSLYPSGSVPNAVRRINNALRRADQIDHMEGKDDVYWYAPIVADAEAGFGGALNAFELTRALIEAGTAAVHLEDQLSSLKKCGHMGGKVLVSPREFVAKLVAARFASDLLGVPTLIVARTDANGARLIQHDSDPVDEPFLTGERTGDGLFGITGGLDCAIARARVYAPFSDMLWCETSTPDLDEAKRFAEAILSDFPRKLLAYNCSPSFNWRRNLDEGTIRRFQDELSAMGYQFQFVTLAGFHTLNESMFRLARAYRDEGMAAYSKFQEEEFALERSGGFDAVRHQHFVGAGYFDEIQMAVSGEATQTVALRGSTEELQFG
jgi:isocitrate lyase